MKHHRKVTLWESAWARYMRALAKADDARQIEDGRAAHGARRSVRAAARNLREVCAKIGEPLPEHWV